MTEVAVLIPGIMGSVLKLGDQVVWPGPVSSLVLPYSMMSQLMREDLVATGCIRSYFVTTQYQSLIDDLKACGFREGDGTLEIFPYDWRKSNALAADALAARLDAVANEKGPDVRFSVIAHSMGGLVARCYLESGRYHDRPAFARVKRLVLCGAPNRGAAVALPVVLGREKRLFLSREQVRELVSDPRYPSAYELLPSRDEPFAWDGAAGAEFAPVDVYSSEVARSLGLVQANMESALAFQATLDPSRRPVHVRYFCFCGTRQTTATYARLSAAQDNSRQADKVERENSGDGTVPIWSSGLPGVQSLQVGGEHSRLYANADVRRVMATILGKPGVLRAYEGGVEVAVREPVMEPGAEGHVVLGFGPGADDLDGEVRVERAVIDPVGHVAGFDAAAVQRYPIRYTGLAASTFDLRFAAPAMRGVYRVAYYASGQAGPAGFGELMVQETA